MNGDDNNTLGMFEGFNFSKQSAIDRNLTAEEVLDWNHCADGEAEFWPDGSNPFVTKLLPRTSFSPDELREVMRIFEEVDAEPIQLAKAIYMHEQGSSLADIGSRTIDDSCLHVFGPGWFVDLEKEAAYELYWPEVYAIWRKSTVPGLSFDVEDFLRQFSTLELKFSDGGFLIVDTE